MTVRRQAFQSEEDGLWRTRIIDDEIPEGDPDRIIYTSAQGFPTKIAAREDGRRADLMVTGAAAKCQAQLAEAQKDNATLTADLEDANQRADHLAADLTLCQESLEASEEKAGALQTALDGATDTINARDVTIEQMQTTIDDKDALIRTKDIQIQGMEQEILNLEAELAACQETPPPPPPPPPVVIGPPHPLFMIDVNAQPDPNQGGKLRWQVPNEGWLEDVEKVIGPMAALRVYPTITDDPTKLPSFGGRWPVISLGRYLRSGSVLLYTDTLAGKHDAALDKWITYLKSLAGRFSWTDRHEWDHIPSEFTIYPSGSATDPRPDLFAQCCSYFLARAAAQGLKDVDAGVIVMGRTLDNPTLAAKSLYPGCRFLMVDRYTEQATQDLGTVFSNAPPFARAHGLRLDIGEFNTATMTDAQEAAIWQKVPAKCRELEVVIMGAFAGAGKWKITTGPLKAAAIKAAMVDGYFHT